MLKKLGFYIKLGIAVILICFLSYSLTTGALPKETNKIPTREEQIINNINNSLNKIIAVQSKLDELVTELDKYTAYQGTKGKGNDWAASMVISYEFKLISLRHLTSVALVKQMLYLNEEAFSTYLMTNFGLIMNFFTTLNASSLNTIEANHKYILNDTIIKESKEGVEGVKKIHEHLVKIFSHFIRQ